MSALPAARGASIGPQKWLALGIAGVAASVLIAAIVVLAVEPWGPRALADLDAFVGRLGDRVAIESTGPSRLKNTVGAERAETLRIDGDDLEVFQLGARVDPPLGAYMAGAQVFLRWADGPPTLISSLGHVFVVIKGPLVVVTADKGLALVARDILRLPKSELIAPFALDLDWARPFAIELQKQGYLVTNALGAIPFVSSESALIYTDGGDFVVERLPEGIDAAMARIERREAGDYAVVIPGMDDALFGGGQAPFVRVSGKGRMLAITVEERLLEPARKALAVAVR